MSSDGRLILLPVLRAVPLEGGRVAITRKFLDGLLEYDRNWDGPLRVWMEPAETRSDNLDNIDVDPGDLPFELELLSFDSPDLARRLEDASVVFGTTSYRQNHLSELCCAIGSACVYGTEYSLKTRRQIINAETGNPALRARRHLWEWNQERRQRKAIRVATGLQCNGTPTFEAYRTLNRNPLLFFDTRTSQDMVIREEDLRQRLAGLGSRRPVRLAFSGRLNRMKGAHYLPRIADRLRSLSVDFTMVICGDGDQAEFLHSELQRLELSDRVDLKGVLEFKTELVPLMQREADLFICPHVQGDPSCTYLETMASGVPIVGFGNEAWQGIVNREDVGSVVPVGDAKGLAQAVARLAAKPERIESLSWNARRMAEAHTFESTFRARIEHLRACAQEARKPA